MKGRISLAAVTLSTTIALSGCGATEQPNTGMVDGPPERACTNVDVAHQVEQIRRDKANVSATAQQGNGKPSANAGDYVYASQPVDIAGPGSYTFSFGPLAEDFRYPMSPSGLGFKVPGDYRGRLAPAAGKSDEARIVLGPDGARYLEISFSLMGDTVSCSELTVFLF